MDADRFTRRFRPEHEIGRDATDATLFMYYDNGTDVGVWRHDRATTIGRGEMLSPVDAAMAQHWFKGRAGGRDRG